MHNQDDRSPTPSGGSAPAGYERTDASTKGVLFTALSIAVAAALVVLAVSLLIHYFSRRHHENRPAQAQLRTPPLTPLSHAPTPQLQISPALDYAAWKQAQERLLHSYGIIRSNNAYARIPIERAMELLIAHPEQIQFISTHHSGASAPAVPPILPSSRPSP